MKRFGICIIFFLSLYSETHSFTFPLYSKTLKINRNPLWCLLFIRSSLPPNRVLLLQWRPSSKSCSSSSFLTESKSCSSSSFLTESKSCSSSSFFTESFRLRLNPQHP
ncbi:hypothetical protein P8452_07653 [Trifolium repens]|nr:hypothetical protein P8452_07653 [Trifolium repens]